MPPPHPPQEETGVGDGVGRGVGVAVGCGVCVTAIVGGGVSTLGEKILKNSPISQPTRNIDIATSTTKTNRMLYILIFHLFKGHIRNPYMV